LEQEVFLHKELSWEKDKIQTLEFGELI